MLNFFFEILSVAGSRLMQVQFFEAVVSGTKKLVTHHPFQYLFYVILNTRKLITPPGTQFFFLDNKLTTCVLFTQY